MEMKDKVSKKSRNLAKQKTFLLHEILTFTSDMPTIRNFQKIKVRRLHIITKYFKSFEVQLEMKSLSEMKVKKTRLYDLLMLVHYNIRNDISLTTSSESLLNEINKYGSVKNLRVLNFHFQGRSTYVLYKFLRETFLFDNLTKLVLNNMYFSSEGLEILCNKHIPNLEWLELVRNDLSNIKSLTKANFPQLKHLNLAANNPIMGVVLNLDDFNLNMFPLLEDLILRSNRMKNIDFLKFTDLPHLKTLDISNCKYTLMGQQMWDFPVMTKQHRLQFLDIGYNLISDNTIKNLVISEFPSLLSLDLTSCSLSSINFLSDLKLPELKYLVLSENDLNGERINSLVTCVFPKLNKLHLKKCNLDHIGISFLCNANFPNLYELDLSGNKIGDKGVENLKQAKFPDLGILDLTYVELTTNSFNILKELNFPKLKILRLEENGIIKILRFPFNFCTNLI